MTLVKYVFMVSCLYLLLPTKLVGVLGQDDDGGTDVEEEPPERTCKKVLFDIIQSFVTGATNCLGGKFRMQSPLDLGTRFYCFFKCILTDLELLNNVGKLDKVKALFFFESAIPEIILDVVLGDAAPCLDLADGFDHSQYYCQSYGPFTQCLVGSMVRTLGPYALQCFATPGIGFFFSFINFIVPQPLGGGASAAAEAREIRKRYTAAVASYNKRHPQNTTALSSPKRGTKRKGH